MESSTVSRTTTAKTLKEPSTPRGESSGRPYSRWHWRLRLPRRACRESHQGRCFNFALSPLGYDKQRAFTITCTRFRYGHRECSIELSMHLVSSHVVFQMYLSHLAGLQNGEIRTQRLHRKAGMVLSRLATLRATETKPLSRSRVKILTGSVCMVTSLLT